jgi:hypothetical protein
MVLFQLATRGTGIAQSVLKLQFGLNSIPARGSRLLFYKTSTPPLGNHPVSHSVTTRSFSPGKRGRVVKLPTHLHPVPRLRMREAVPSVTTQSSWRGARSQTRPHLHIHGLVTFQTPLALQAPFLNYDTEPHWPLSLPYWSIR